MVGCACGDEASPWPCPASIGTQQALLVRTKRRALCTPTSIPRTNELCGYSLARQVVMHRQYVIGCLLACLPSSLLAQLASTSNGSRMVQPRNLKETENTRKHYHAWAVLWCAGLHSTYQVEAPGPVQLSSQRWRALGAAQHVRQRPSGAVLGHHAGREGAHSQEGDNVRVPQRAHQCRLLHHTQVGTTRAGATRSKVGLAFLRY